MRTFQIHFEGQVQGVGFRPHVFQLASKMDLRGVIANGTDGVTIVVNGTKRECYTFYHELIFAPPANAIITKSSIEEIADQYFENFSILESTADAKPTLMVTPDLAMCEPCRQELHDSANRRYHYAFTTCLNCGPRYSIMERLPYDRENTVMNKFTMCSPCDNEYHNPLDRRHHSQTNSCSDCAIQMSLVDAEGKNLQFTQESIVADAVDLLRRGKIVAVKGIGGFLLMCDAGNSATVRTLRERKHRPTKPFAVLYPDLAMIKRDLFVSDAEEKTLTSKESPIVLLAVRPYLGSKLPLEQIAPGLNKVGVMLPYAPLFELLASKFGRPLIATSANVSRSPIVYTNEKAIEDLNGIADYFLLHNREIVVPQDDSVVQFAASGKSIFLRRSRGYAPTYLPRPFDEPASALAMGSDMKSAFSLNDEGRLFVSQYLGDLESFDTQHAFHHTLSHLLALQQARPSRILVDQHPHYFSTELGKSIAEDLGVPLESIQHHQAHFCAVLAENKLLEDKEGTLGVIWDGTGWGEDKAVWGGEFFTYKSHHIERIGHLDYFDHLLGDKMSLEPRISALSLGGRRKEAEALLKPKFSSKEWELYRKILSQDKLPQTSSMGRLFDAVASLLGVCDQSSYEGEAALLLESLASREAGLNLSPWTIDEHEPFTDEIIKNVIANLQDQVSRHEIAYQFHLTLVDWVALVATRQRSKKIAFSGGVFQNALLVDMLEQQLGNQFELFFHQQLSPNDENISFGQLAFLYVQNKKASKGEVPEEFEVVLK